MVCILVAPVLVKKVLGEKDKGTVLRGTNVAEDGEASEDVTARRARILSHALKELGQLQPQERLRLLGVTPHHSTPLSSSLASKFT